ncbi:MAG: RNA methyltransferase [Clostridia bacterium]|nr:RNA methyltransferase [Clostridia bacterium]
MDKLISSITNSYIKHLKKLQTSRKYREQTGTFLLEGERPVTDAVNMGIIPVKIIITENYKGKAVQGDCLYITEKVGEYLSDTITPQGIMAEMKIPEYNAEDISPENSPFLVYSDGVSDPGNLGTIVRSLTGAGANGLILSKGSVDLYNPKTVRSTMSAIFSLPIYRTKTAEVLNILKIKGYKIIGTRMEDAENYTDTDLTSPSVFVMGNEAKGISDEVMAVCDSFISIPLVGNIESLNVGVATSLVAYEVLRQKNNKKGK